MTSVNPAIVIPVHQPSPSFYELNSLRNVYHVLGDYNAYLVCPNSMDTSIYKSKAPNLKTIRLPDSHFKNVRSYNMLRKSSDLYRMFKAHSHVLFHELDSYVFRDELTKWCVLDVDYIGAPWMHTTKSGELKCIGVGNSGLCLMRVQPTIDLLEEFEESLKVGSDYFNNDPIFGWRDTRKLIHSVLNVDIYISSIAKGTKYKIASYEQSKDFSFESKPKLMYLANNNKLPFGCHAWRRRNKKFWSKFIK